MNFLRFSFLLIIILFSTFSIKAFSYHHFYAMGYSSCMTCHYNPQGSGPLNDYGRALFATELSSRWYVPNKISDEKLGENAGFFWGAKTPYWLKPHLKIRFLQITQNHNTPIETKKTYAMQREIGLTVPLNEEETSLWLTTFSINDEQGRFRTSQYQKFPTQGVFLKEFYYRKAIKDRWILIGMQDKPFGIRDANHTLFSRQLTRLTQYDQSFGGTYFHPHEKFEWTIMGFMGNVNEPSDLRIGGISTVYEYQISDQSRLGFSFLTQKNNYTEIYAFSLQSRINANYAASLAIELGYVNATNLTSKTSISPIYFLGQAMYRLVRGWNFIFENEIYRPEFTSNALWVSKTYFGLLAFVIPRGELRINLNNGKTINFNQGQQDDWQLQTQVHFAF